MSPRRKSTNAVTPAKAGDQLWFNSAARRKLDSRLRGNDVGGSKSLRLLVVVLHFFEVGINDVIIIIFGIAVALGLGCTIIGGTAT